VSVDHRLKRIRPKFLLNRRSLCRHEGRGGSGGHRRLDDLRSLPPTIYLFLDGLRKHGRGVSAGFGLCFCRTGLCNKCFYVFSVLCKFFFETV